MTEAPTPLIPNGSRYRIIEKLGDGGMGVVYKAQDSRLARLVALKFLPPEFERDSQALARFQREAQAASALNNPHICTIYDIGEQDGRTFIDMELIDGDTLKARMHGRALPLEMILRYSMQIAEALDAAHKRGIVHRDEKPSNIFVSGANDIKLADFGLAKQLALENTPESDTATISAPVTMAGQIVGTVAYMSPEQAQDKHVDARGDIFSFGIVIYEMAAGRRPFNGDSAAALLSEILRAAPRPLREQNPDVPEELQRIVTKALEKDRDDRYQAVSDLVVDLRRLARQESTTPQGVAVQGGPADERAADNKWLWVFATALIAVIVLSIIVFTGSRSIPATLAVEQITFSSAPKGPPLLTDGARIFFRSAGEPVEMSVKGGSTAPMRAAADMNIVDISPDASEFLLVKADVNDESGHGSLWTVPVLGGSPKRVGDVLAKSATFSQDGHLIAYTEWQAIGVIGSDGQNRKEVWKAPRNIDGWAHFSPDARRIRFTIDGENSDTPVKIWEVNVDGTNVHPIKLDWPTSVDQFDGQWTPDGRHFVFTSGRMGLAGIYEVLEPRWFEFWKRPRASLISPVQMDVEAVTPSRDSSGLFAIGRTPQGTMQSFDPKQKRWIPYLGGINASTMLVSPDKQWIAYTDYPRHFLWRSKPDGRERLQLNSMFTWMPQWSPNSKEIAFTDGIEIYKVAFDGGVPEKLTSEGQFEISPSWWPDGKSIVFSDFPDPGHRAGLKILDLASRMVWIMPNTQTFHVGIWAPDGKYMTAIASPPIRMVLYSAETGKWTDLKKFQTDPGFFVWSPDSKALYMLKLTPEPGDEQGVYRLSVPDGNWQLAASLVGVNPSDDFHENAPAFSPRASSWI